VIEPWQVWLADLDPFEGHEQGGVRPVVVVSSEFHLRLMGGRMVTVMPLTSTDFRLSTRIKVSNPQNGRISYAITDQVRTVSTNRFERTAPWWTLKDGEVSKIRQALQKMVDF
jgi:mRNA interferase MazF